MIGIENIAGYVCSRRIKNSEKQFAGGEQADPVFLEKKLGILATSIKESDENTFELCIKAFNNLTEKCNIDVEKIDCVCLCTQSHDNITPHNSARIMDRLHLKPSCAAFDINMGCGGYAYSLSIMKSFMESNGLKNGLMFNCEIFSDKLSRDDMNAGLVFGDAASVTLLSENYKFSVGMPLFYTDGSMADALILTHDLNLTLNSIPIFSFIMGNVPELVYNTLEKNNLQMESIDLFAFQQTGKYIIDNLSRRMKIDKEKIPFVANDYGNTSSVSVSLVLNEYFNNENIKNILLCGFGEGLSASAIPLVRR